MYVDLRINNKVHVVCYLFMSPEIPTELDDLIKKHAGSKDNADIIRNFFSTKEEDIIQIVKRLYVEKN